MSATERLEASCEKKGLVLIWEGPTPMRGGGGVNAFGITITRSSGAFVCDASIIQHETDWTPEIRDDLASSLLASVAEA